MPTDTVLRLALLYPEILGTYGDVGNARVLAQRARWRGLNSEIAEVDIDDDVPESCDIYLVGGGEDAAQTLAATRLITHGGLRRAVDRGAVVLGVCAGLQLLGTSFEADGRAQDGVGLIDATTTRMSKRAVGDCLVDVSALPLSMLVGFENHGGGTTIGSGSQPLGRVVSGVGNGHDGVDGAVNGRVVATYLHGPVLACNPALADLMLEWATGEQLAPLDVAEVDALRAWRLARLGSHD